MKQLYRYRDLIVTLVQRDLKVRYKRSAIGFLWTMLQPLLMMMVLNVVFSTLFQFEETSEPPPAQPGIEQQASQAASGTEPEVTERRGIRNYPVYALAGLLFWNFFQQTIVTSMNSLQGNATILKKLPVPLAVFPIATVISGLVNLLFACIPLIAILIVTGHRLTSALFFLPVSILIVAIFTMGAGLLLSPLAVFFSDVVELVGVVLMLMFYMTPVIYPKGIVAGTKFYWAVHYNPVRSILEVFRDPIYYGKIPPASHLSLAALIAGVMLVIGILSFRKSADRIPFYI